MDADGSFLGFLLVLLLAALVISVLLVAGLGLIIIYAASVIALDLARIVIAAREGKRRADDSNASP